MARRGHDFITSSYGLTPTQCFVCGDFLNGIPGISAETFQCQSCAINVHDACRSLTSSTCFVTHRFRPRSELLVTPCQACGQPLLGFWNQGFFKCEDCGVCVHAACRTQSSISACRHAAPAPTSEAPKASSSAPIDAASHATNDATSTTAKRRSSRLLSNIGLATGSSSALTVIPDLDGDLEAIKLQILKAHHWELDFVKAESEVWEKQLKPALKAQRASLQTQYDNFKSKQREKTKEILALAEVRDEAFRIFLKSFYTRFNASKATAKQIAQVVQHYGKGRCRELELFDALASKYEDEPAAQVLISAERSSPLLVKAELENAMGERDRLASSARKIKLAIDKTVRDLQFPTGKNWLFKLGAEGNFAAFTGVWVEEIAGKLGLHIGMRKASEEAMAMSGGEGPSHLPRIVLRLTNEKGDGKDNTGLRFAVRVEDFYVTGAALPVSLSLREAQVVVEFDLSIEAEYRPATTAGDEDQAGSWYVVDKSFSLKVHKFSIKTIAMGNISLPDSVLGVLIRSFITAAFKRIIVLALPPEAGAYMLAIHEHRRRSAVSSAHNDMWIRSLEARKATTADGVFGKYTEEDDAGSTSERTFHIIAPFSVRSKLELGAMDAPIDSKSNPHSERAREALGLTFEQAELLVQTQKILGMTMAQLLPSSGTDWLSQLAQTAASAAGVGGGLTDTTRLPLLSVLDLVRYRREFLANARGGEVSSAASSRNAATLIGMWQQALDAVQAGGTLDKGGLGGKMKRLVARAAPARFHGPGLDFAALVQRLGDIDRGPFTTTTHVQVFELNLAVRAMIRAFRDVALRFAVRAKGNETSLPDGKKGTLKSSGKPGGVGSQMAAAVASDGVAHEGGEIVGVFNVPDLKGKTLKVQIERVSDLLLHHVREIHERYLDTLKVGIELVAGKGEFRGLARDFSLLSPIDVGISFPGTILAKILSHTSELERKEPRKAPWPWSRRFGIEDGQWKMTMSRPALVGSLTDFQALSSAGGASALMAAALKRLGQKDASANQVVNSPPLQFSVQGGGFYAQFKDVVAEQRGVSSNPSQATLRDELETSQPARKVSSAAGSAAGGMKDAVTVRVRPVAGPDRVEVRALGASTMRVHFSADRIEARGAIHAFFQLVNDIINHFPAIKQVKFLDRFISTFYLQESLYLDVLANLMMRGVPSAGDLYLGVSNLAGKSLLNLSIGHHLREFFQDLQDFLDALTSLATSGSTTGSSDSATASSSS